MIQTKLTIGIPTYNGGSTIGETLDSIVSQLNDLNDPVEILVSDNASDDNTKEVIDKYIDTYSSYISYYKNKTNLGYDLNVDNIFQKAKGEYVWLLGDDDVHYSGSLKYALDILKDESIDIVTTNFDLFEKDMKNIIHQMVINNGNDLKCRDHKDFFLKAGGRYGNLSSIIMKTSVWRNFDNLKGIGCQYLPVYVLLHNIPFCVNYIIAKPMFKARSGSVKFENSVDNEIYIPLNGIRIFKSLNKKQYGAELYNKMLNEQRDYVIKKMISANKKAIRNSRRVFIDMIKFNYEYFPFWIALLDVLFINRFRLSIKNVKKIVKAKVK